MNGGGGRNSVHFDLNGNNSSSHYKTSTGNGNFSTSNQDNKKVVMNSSTNLHWLLHRLFVIGDYESCNKLIEQQIIETFDHEYLYYVKGLILRNEGKHQEALKHFQKTIDFGTKNPQHYKEIGRTLYQMEKYNQSLEMFLKAESFLESPDHEIYHFIGKLMCLNVKHQAKKSTSYDAKEYFKRAIMSGHQLNAYLTLAMIYRKEKEFHKSVELLENCLSFHPDNVEVMTELGILFLKLNDVELAYEKLQNVVALDNASSESILALGAILQTKSDVEGALNTYKNIPNIQSEGFELWNNIGMCFYRKNKLIAAISCLKKSLWLSPLCFNSLYNLGIVLLTAQQFASAFQCFVNAVSIKPESAESFMMLAICLYYLNDIDNAQIAFRKAILSKSAITNPLIYLNYSIFAIECTRNFDDAQQYLSNFYNLCETMKVPQEFIQIASAVLSRLPTTMQLPETRPLPPSSAELRETKIPPTEELDRNENDDEVHHETPAAVQHDEGDLV